MNGPSTPTLRALHKYALQVMYDVLHFDEYDDTTEEDLILSAQEHLERITTGEYQRVEDLVSRICDDADLESSREYARLIQAAPDLLEACKTALGAIRLEQQINPAFSPAWQHVADQLADAITKTEGGA